MGLVDKPDTTCGISGKNGFSVGGGVEVLYGVTWLQQAKHGQMHCRDVKDVKEEENTSRVS